MHLYRPIRASDLDAIVELARRHDSMNLPDDRAFLAERIERSEASFSRSVEDWRDRIYMFVAEAVETGDVIGTSLILAKHGSPSVPFYWLEVTREDRSSEALGKHFVHEKLRLRSSTDGPTEVGGLVVDPRHRGRASGCGKCLSAVRFAYMAMHPECFEREVVADIVSVPVRAGETTLWDVFGAHFTGVSYREADHLSARDKSFIADLLPQDPVYTTFFPESVRAQLGRPADEAIPAVKILEKLGFSYLNQIDPFDGGPYFGCARDAIVSVRDRRTLVLPSALPAPGELDAEERTLISAEGALGFRSTMAPCDAHGTPLLDATIRTALGIRAGDEVLVTPLP
ncbi:MAG: arginine N-succinyltransferase [Deltaproteobacteria bacterium]|nr:arginine N-succinyltransferase [Deltaproteobacteria bacterium]MBW2362770.1 arginine N-succinyltransferase [Deltaproteobacteria bacterium]